MTVIALQSESERASRAEFIREARAACLQGVSPTERARKREETADAWAQWLHQRMDASNCADPIALLPDILAKMEQTIDDRVTAAIAEIKAKLTGALK
jgi:hypothetical protein